MGVGMFEYKAEHWGNKRAVSRTESKSSTAGKEMDQLGRGVQVVNCLE